MIGLLTIAMFFNRPATQPAAVDARVPVVVELFTSESCSSCPPAEALLTKLAQDHAIDGARIIPLEFHIDYWNSLGWKDRFSHFEFSDRQANYAKAFGLPGGYTPQMIVDGHSEFTGSSESSARIATARAVKQTKPPIQLSVAISEDTSKLQARVQFPAALEKSPLDFFLAVTEDNLSTKVARGENAGRELHHTAVVRQFKRLDAFDAQVDININKEWKLENLHVIVFAQRRDTMEIISAESKSVEAKR